MMLLFMNSIGSIITIKITEKVLQQYKGESLSVVIDGPYAIADASFSIGVDAESLNVQLGPKKDLLVTTMKEI